MAHQWRGVIEEYRDRLDIPDNTPTITLREGGTPMVDSDWLSDRLLQRPRHDRRAVGGRWARC